MEMNTWIAKDKTHQTSSGFPSYASSINDMHNACIQRQSQQAQQNEQRGIFEKDPIIPDVDFAAGYDEQDLGHAAFSIDDFFTSPDEGSEVTIMCEQMIEMNAQSESHVQHLSEWSRDGQSSMFSGCQVPINSGVSSVAPLLTATGFAFGHTGGATGGHRANEAASELGSEIFRRVIMRHLVQDIKATCARLNIVQDPKLWTQTDARAWLTDMSAQFHLAQVPCDNLSMNGTSLCGMTLAQFKQCFLNGGEVMHAQLQIWKSANEYCKCQSSANISSHDSVLCSASSCSADYVTIPGVTSTSQDYHQNHGQQQDSFKCVENDLTGYVAAQLASSVQLTVHEEQTNLYDQAIAVNNGGLRVNLPSTDIRIGGGQPIDCESGSESDDGAISGYQNIHLWEFMRELLDQQDSFSHCVRWVDQNAGTFKIEDSHKLARLWGQRKNRPAMNYDKLSRSLRQYYKKGILKKTKRTQRLLYQFQHPYHVCTGGKFKTGHVSHMVEK